MVRMKNLTRRSRSFSSKFTVGEVKSKDPKDARVLLGTLTGCLEFVLIGLSHGMKWQCYQSPNMSVILSDKIALCGRRMWSACWLGARQLCCIRATR